MIEQPDEQCIFFIVKLGTWKLLDFIAMAWILLVKKSQFIFGWVFLSVDLHKMFYESYTVVQFFFMKSKIHEN